MRMWYIVWFFENVTYQFKMASSHMDKHFVVFGYFYSASLEPVRSEFFSIQTFTVFHYDIKHNTHH